MRRVLYSIPLFAMLLPWTFIAFVVLGIGLFHNPYSLPLILPVALFLGGAGLVHRRFTKREQHGRAALGAAALLFAPLFAIVVAFACHGGEVLSRPEFRPMVRSAVADVGTPKESCGHYPDGVPHGRPVPASIQF